MDYVAFERRLLHLMFRTNAPLTPVHVAFYLDLPIAEARTHLDHMVEMGVLELDSDEKGNLIYTYPMRPPAAELPAPKPPDRRPHRRKRGGAEAGQGQRHDATPSRSSATRSSSTANDPADMLDNTAAVLALRGMPVLARPPQPGDEKDRSLELVLVDGRRYYSPAAAAALSLFLPGVGQIYTGRVAQGVGWMLATGMGYLFFLIPGLILHICCIVNAAAVPARVPMLAERVR